MTRRPEETHGHSEERLPEALSGVYEDTDVLIKA